MALGFGGIGAHALALGTRHGYTKDVDALEAFRHGNAKRTGPCQMEEADAPDPGQIDRLWQHGLHEDTVFNDRLNFFLVFESVLLGLIAMLIDEGPSSYKWTLTLLTCLGLAVTIVWSYIQAKQRLILKILSRRCREVLPEYRETLSELEQHKWRIVSGTALMAYFIPGLIALVWVGLLGVIWS